MWTWFVAVGLALAWLVPLHFLPWVSWHSELLAFAAVFLGAGYGLFEARRPDRQLVLPWTGLAGVLAGLAVVVVLQALAGDIAFAGDALVLLLYLALALTSALAGTAIGQGPAAAQSALGILAWTLLGGAMVTTLIAFVQVLDVWSAQDWIVRMQHLRRPGGNLGQPNQMATLLIMGLASLVYLHEKEQLGRVLTGLCALILCAGLAITESRTGALNVLLLAGWLAYGRLRAGLRMAWAPILLAVACYAGLLLAWPGIMTFLQGAATGAQLDVSGGLRLVVWPQLLEATALRPWSGWGLREVSQAHNAVAHDHPVSEPYTYAHNILLDLVLGVGWPLALLLVAGALVWLGRRVPRTRDPAAWYAAAIVLPVALHSMLEFPYAYAYFLAPMMFALGIFGGLTAAPGRWRLGRSAAAAGLTLCIGFGGWTVLEYVRIEEDFRIVRFEDMRVGKTPDEYARPEIHLLTQLAALLEAGRIVPAPGMSGEQIDLARKVALRYPWPATQKRYAMSLALNGEPQEARRQMQVIRALHGDKAYQAVKSQWSQLAAEKYPQLQAIVLP